MITVIGLDGSPLGEEAVKALAGATLVVGGERHLAAVLRPGGTMSRPGGTASPPGDTGVTTMPLGKLTPALDALASHEGDAVVLASGDPGFFGIVRALRQRGLAYSVQPARSSVSLAFARAGLAWDDALVVSAHGRDPRRAVNVCRAHPKVAVLTGPELGPAELGAALDGWPRRLLVAEHLGTADERMTECSPAAAASGSWDDPNVVLVLAGDPGGAEPSWSWPLVASPDGWALPEDDFGHRDSMVTKAEIRALALARLAPRPGALIWDVGAGSGSVGVECGRFGAAVIAVERDPSQCELVAENARRHGVDVRVIAGEAPAALTGLPDPDAVFIGGGGPAVAEAVAALGPRRIVVVLAAIERAGPVHAALTAAGYAVGGVLLQAARFSPLPGGVHRLAAQNPVFLLWAGRDTGPDGGPRAEPGAGPAAASPTEPRP